jgi:ethanolamine utilization protein EutP (predicted NTPase)
MVAVDIRNVIGVVGKTRCPKEKKVLKVKEKLCNH